MDEPVGDPRQQTMQQGLSEQDVDPDPIQQFARWFELALREVRIEPTAMTLATATPDGRPAARMVLLKGFDARGFVFYTNYQSRKGCELEDNPHAALVFWWGELERQVRIEGRVEKVSAEESEAYFRTRPWYSQLGAAASDQSRVLESRQVLEQRALELLTRYAAQPVPRPAHWGGYRLRPHCIEFWQGRESRLHDRLEYRMDAGGQWVLRRLWP